MRLAAYLIMTLLFSTATAQNPTILKGDYISNVFGQSNFVKNPNAQTGVAYRTLTNANAQRSTTTPLVATTEWNVTITSANGTVAWETRAFDAGMKNQNCEARFTYRGFQATSKAQVKQGANVVAELVLTPSATDPRIASINFPCGDLSQPTTFVITDTAILSGTHEIGGIYVGLATNMANIAQAENVVQVGKSNTQPFTSGVEGTLLFDVETKDVYNEYDPSTGIFTAKRAGDYLVTSSVLSDSYSWSAGQYSQLNISKNNQSTCRNFYQVAAPVTINVGNFVACTITLSVGETIRTKWQQNRGTTNNLGGVTYTYMMISRFPSSSELVVTPETQNVWGGVVYTAENQMLFSGTASPTSYTPYNNSTWNKPANLVGKAQVTTTNSGNDLGFSIPNMPVGNYKITISGLINAANNGATNSLSWSRCNFRIVETDSSGTLRTEIARQTHQDYSFSTNNNDESRDYVNSFFGVYNNTSVATRNFRLEAQKFSDTSTGSLGGCQAFSNTGTNSYNSNIAFTIEPLDNNANSALYVQGPVKAAGTGTDIPTGYIGEVKHQNLSTCGGGSYSDGATVTITPGIWQVQVTYAVNLPGNILDILTFVGTPGSNNWRISGYNDGWISAGSFANPFSRMAISSPIQFIKYDGSTMYLYLNGSWQQATASATGQITARFLRNTATCVTGYSSIQATRLN